MARIAELKIDFTTIDGQISSDTVNSLAKKIIQLCEKENASVGEITLALPTVEYLLRKRAEAILSQPLSQKELS